MNNRVTDRRPISARDNPLSKRVTLWLVGLGISPNAISIASVVLSIGAAVCLLLTATEFSHPILWGFASILIVLRLFANMFDGMVAVETGVTSPLGDLYNEVPDRISDVIIFVSAGYAAGSMEMLGYAAALCSLFIAYVRALGNSMGVSGLFIGPMAKSHRMFTLAGVCLAIAFFQEFLLSQQALTWGLSVIVVGSILTIARRLRRIVVEATHA
jgi:phosphatidylglycerophosphate synthase